MPIPRQVKISIGREITANCLLCPAAQQLALEKKPQRLIIPGRPLEHKPIAVADV